CGRPMVLSLSPGETPLADSAHVKRWGNMWRMADDFWDSWAELLKMFDYAKKWEGIGGAGHWPDCDMLQIGKVSKRGPVGPERYSRFTEDELVTHFSFWCLYRSPLMIGGNLPDDRELEERLFSNPEVLAVNQEGLRPRQVAKGNGQMIWVSDAGGGALYVGAFNISDGAMEMSVDFGLLGMRRAAMVRDLWERRDVGRFARKYSRILPAHGCMLLKIFPR
ncbi:MAG TPA: hypothetical protein VGM89_02450, partial [Puia sp.]